MTIFCFIPKEYFLIGSLLSGSSPTFFMIFLISSFEILFRTLESIFKLSKPFNCWHKPIFSIITPTFGMKSISLYNILLFQCISPSVGRIIPDTLRISIVLPEPFFPTRPYFFPEIIFKFTFFNISRPLILLETLFINKLFI